MKNYSQYFIKNACMILKMANILAIIKMEYRKYQENNEMQRYIWETPEEITKVVATHTKVLRKRLKISRQKLSEMSGVSYGSIKRFEETGNISLLSLTKVAMALDASEDIKNIFSDVPYKSIQEVINEQR